MGRTVNAREANQHFSKLLASAIEGEEIIILRHGEPVAKLVPFVRADAAEDRVRRIREADDMLARLDALAVHAGGYRFRREDAYEDD